MRPKRLTSRASALEALGASSRSAPSAWRSKHLAPQAPGAPSGCAQSGWRPKRMRREPQVSPVGHGHSLGAREAHLSTRAARVWVPLVRPSRAAVDFRESHARLALVATWSDRLDRETACVTTSHAYSSWLPKRCESGEIPGSCGTNQRNVVAHRAFLRLATQLPFSLVARARHTLTLHGSTNPLGCPTVGCRLVFLAHTSQPQRPCRWRRPSSTGTRAQGGCSSTG